MSEHLFFYGTLLPGLARPPLAALVGRLVPLGPATVPGRLYDLGPYPGLVADLANGLAVRGELWEVDADCLAELDEYEQAPGLFVREPVAVQGLAAAVEAFVYARPVPPAARSGTAWPFPAGG